MKSFNLQSVLRLPIAVRPGARILALIIQLPLFAPLCAIVLMGVMAVPELSVFIGTLGACIHMSVEHAQPAAVGALVGETH